jgi:hypothetical protein
MVTTKPTQSPQGASDDSVRITAAVRHQVEVDLLTRELARQQVIADSEARDLRSLKNLGLPSASAERRASNATAVLQYIGATLAAYGDNRDFRGVSR